MFLPDGPYNPTMPSEQETILVVETGRLGDLVMATPALETLRRGAPEARIVVAGGWPLAILERGRLAARDLVARQVRKRPAAGQGVEEGNGLDFRCAAAMVHFLAF